MAKLAFIKERYCMDVKTSLNLEEVMVIKTYYTRSNSQLVSKLIVAMILEVLDKTIYMCHKY